MSTTTTDHIPLTHKKCVPCEGGVPVLSKKEAEGLLKQLQGWSLSDDARRVRRVWVAKNFMAAIDFFKKVAELAEAEGHHPDLRLEGYRNVTIEMTTHAIGGLSENDFILAAKIDAIPIQVKSH